MHPKDFDDLLSFQGHSSKECEDYIIKVTKAAFHQCFLRDDERVAALAAAGLEGRALKWFEGLPSTSAARDDWQILRQHMLDEWSPDSESEVEDPPPSYDESGVDTRLSAPGGFIRSETFVADAKTPEGGEKTSLVLNGKEKITTPYVIGPRARVHSRHAKGSS
ncbi:hypothetical protein FRB90_003557 [Tulasnella sp. 427]|nr:hypothetical protein FRB90_003557 [Tulasnella sp. 427]